MVLILALAGLTATGPEPLRMGEGRSVMMYRSHSLQKGQAKALRALIVIHGAVLNADDYFASGMAGAYLAGGLEETIVVAPRFAGTGTKTCDDKLALGEIGFACSGNDWRGGGPAVVLASVTTCDVIDELIRRFAD